jgi:hypothetical protein
MGTTTVLHFGPEAGVRKLASDGFEVDEQQKRHSSRLLASGA